VDLIPLPWSWLLDEGEGRTPLRPEGETAIDGVGSPRVVLLQSDQLRWSGGGGEAPIAGFPFVDRDQVSRCMYHLPASSVPQDGEQDHTTAWTCRGVAGQLLQLHLAMRPRNAAADHVGVHLDQCIQWAVHSFLELAQSNEMPFTDSLVNGLVRRSWERARKIWLAPDPAEPRMELIIKLAQDADLRAALESVGAHPRRILLRIRDQTPVGRVTELDAACIRDYARRPGRTAFEKAGVTQRLLAVQRQASFDTLENRLACWTLDELQRRSQLWTHRHSGSRALRGVRARMVQRLARQAQNLRNGEHLVDLAHAALAHPVVANYPLQMEPRYRAIFGAYQQLLRYRRIQDEAWTWRRPLWTDTVRQLVYCTLVAALGEPVAQSAPYYRTEGERGRWVASPSAPGPFRTSHGEMYIIDAHDAEQVGPDWHAGLGCGWATRIGMLGADTILWWPAHGSVVVIWGHLWCGDAATVQQHVDGAAEALQRFAEGMVWETRQRIAIAGIIISSDSSGTAVGQYTNTRHNRLAVGLTIPMRVDTTDEQQFQGMTRDLSAGISMAVEAVCA